MVDEGRDAEDVQQQPDVGDPDDCHNVDVFGQEQGVVEQLTVRQSDEDEAQDGQVQDECVDRAEDGIRCRSQVETVKKQRTEKH